MIAGHGRLEAAKLLGLDRVPVIRVLGLSREERLALMVADNKLGDNSDWSDDKLAAVLKDLADANFEIEDLGFEFGEIDALLKLGVPDGSRQDEVEQPDPDAPIVSRGGDAFAFGDHRLICGDARDPAVYDWLMGGTVAAMAFADPPYNVRIDGHVMGSGLIQHAEFVMASGEMSPAEFISFLSSVMDRLVAVSADGSIQTPGDYKVGYGRPPRQHQWRPGKSGNRRGRPKGRQNLKTDLQAELSQTITIREGDRQVRITKQRTLVKSTVAHAIKGDSRAQAKAFELLLPAFGIDDEIENDRFVSPDDAEIVRRFLERKEAQKP